MNAGGVLCGVTSERQGTKEEHVVAPGHCIALLLHARHTSGELTEVQVDIMSTNMIDR